MNGAEALIRTAAAAGVEVCFANPGTTEMHLVDALDRESGVRAVLGLFEGVVTGAADGYGRMAGKPALTLLHLGPGFANGIANLHNARRGQSPIVNLIGHHATWHRNFDAPLNSDVEDLAGPVSAWVRTNSGADQASRDLADAITAARTPPGRIATLIVPGDSQWDAAPEAVVAPRSAPAHRVDPGTVEATARALAGRQQGSALILLGGACLGDAGLAAAGRIAARTSCRLGSETFASRMERGAGRPLTERLPYFPEQAEDFFAGIELVVLAGARDPVAFFGYEGGRSRLVPDDVAVTVLAAPEEDAAAALHDLADALEARDDAEGAALELPPPPTGPLSPSTIAQALALHLPEGAIVVDEGITSAGAFYPVSRTARSHTYLNLTGGAIGWGLPCATGAALACPDRKVVTLEGDGSGLYTVQALWTQARESLDVVNVVFANNLYRILQVELARAGVEEAGPQSLSLTDLSRPAVDWPRLSESFGVPATSVTTAEELAAAFEQAVAEPGPRTLVVELDAAAGPISPP